MKQNEQMMQLSELSQLAETDVVLNANDLPKVFSNYSKDEKVIPVSVTFMQSRNRPIFEKSTEKGKRGAKIDEVYEERMKPFKFGIGNATDFRVKFGAALNELENTLDEGKKEIAKVNGKETRQPFLKTIPLHVAFNFGGYVFSTTMLEDSGVKLSKCYHKGQFVKNLYHTEFCRPLFKQLQKLERMIKGLPLEVSDDILTSIGLKSLDKK